MTGPGITAPDPIRDRDDPGPFSAVAWRRTATVRAAIDELPLLRQLADGTLPLRTFAHYLAQDALYLADLGRALAAAAAQAAVSEEMAFWAQCARDVVEVERSLHAVHVGDLTAAEPSPTTVAYTSYLLAQAASGDYPTLAAALLPCFQVYDDVGTRLKATAGDLAAHPYGAWIATYGDPDFTATTEAARDIVDRLAALSGPATRARMHTAFHRATQYEWMFWDAAHRHETWPVG